MKGTKQALTKDSIEQALVGGAKTMTDIAHAHGYKGNVSGDVTKVIRQHVPKIGEILADIKAGKAFKPVQPVETPAVVVAQRKSYAGKVYGKVFEAAVQVGKEQGEQPRKEVVSLVARKTELSEQQVAFALQVFTTPKHLSNQGRSRNAATERGHVLLVPAEGVEG
jgi:hypothetical protein